MRDPTELDRSAWSGDGPFKIGNITSSTNGEDDVLLVSGPIGWALQLLTHIERWYECRAVRHCESENDCVGL